LTRKSVGSRHRLATSKSAITPGATTELHCGIQLTSKWEALKTVERIDAGGMRSIEIFNARPEIQARMNVGSLFLMVADYYPTPTEAMSLKDIARIRQEFNCSPSRCLP